eukprot:3266833-Karenia_brevis.AAC.1
MARNSTDAKSALSLTNVMANRSPTPSGGSWLALPKNLAYYTDKNAKHLLDNGANGAHGMPRQYYTDNK